MYILTCVWSVPMGNNWVGTTPRASSTLFSRKEDAEAAKIEFETTYERPPGFASVDEAVVAAPVRDGSGASTCTHAWYPRRNGGPKARRCVRCGAQE